MPLSKFGLAAIGTTSAMAACPSDRPLETARPRLAEFTFSNPAHAKFELDRWAI